MLIFILACAEPKQSSLNAPEIRILPEASYTGDSLLVEIVTEPVHDEGALSYQYTWYVNEEIQPDLTADTVEGELVIGHQSWRVVVDAALEFDDVRLTSQAQAEHVVSNTAPTVDIEQRFSFASSEDVVLAVDTVDVDGDDIDRTLAWLERNGSEYAGDVLHATETTRGEIWSLQVTADDGHEPTQAIIEQIEIVNSPPVIESLEVPQEITRAEDVVFSISGSDYDGDDMFVDVAWYVDDNLVQEGTQPYVPVDCLEGQEDCCFDEGVPSSSCASVLSTDYFVQDSVVRLDVTLRDEQDSSLIEQREVIVSNAAPVIEYATIEPSPVFAGSTVECISNGYVDFDGDAEQSIFSWVYNGQEISQGPTLVLSDFGLVHLDEISCVVTPSDGLASGVPVSVAVVLSNTPAVVSQVSLGPIAATEDEILTCTDFGYTDDDGESATIEYGWLIDGVDIGESGNTLTGEHFDKNQSVQCYATADDGTDIGEMTISDETIVIDNDIPFIAGISIVPSAVTRASTLTCSYIGYSDSDPSDSDQSIVEWFSGTTKVGDGTIFDVGASSLERGEYISCSVTPFDGFDAGYPFTKTLVIYNALPQISNLQLSPDPAYTNDVLEVQADIVDPDNDAFTIEYAWFVDGVELANITTPTLDGAIFFHKGQEVYAEIHVTDPFGTKVEETQTITIGNTPPPAPEIEITPTNVYVDDDLLCTVTNQENDEDGDPITYLFEWEQNGSVFSNSTTGVLAGDTIASTYTNFGDVWTCNVYAVDDDLAQTLSSGAIDICPLGQFEECAAQSCDEIHHREYSDPDRNGIPNDDLYWIDPLGTGTYEAFCDMSHDDGGWTMLLSVDGDSNYWGNSSANWDTSPIDFATIDATNTAHSIYFAPSSPTQEDKHLAPYEQLSTNEIRLCYEDLSRCYTFAHNQDIPLMNFFTDGISHVEYAYNVRGIPDVGSSDIELTNFVLGMGREPYGGNCEWLGINNINSGSAIGFLADDGGACLGSSAGVFDQVALGLGLQSCADGNGCSEGWDIGNLAGQQRNLRVVGAIVQSKFWVFGR